MSSKATDLAPSVALSFINEGSSRLRMASTAATFIAVGKHVVGRLAHVDVVVRVHQPALAALAAQQLAGPVGQHLVDVHVGLGARSGLPDHQGEFLVVPPGQHLVGGGDDGRRLVLRQQAHQVVHDRGGAFDLRQGPDDFTRLALAGNIEVLQGALGLRAPQALGRHLHRAEGIAFCSGFHGGVRLSCQNSGCRPPYQSCAGLCIHPSPGQPS